MYHIVVFDDDEESGALLRRALHSNQFAATVADSKGALALCLAKGDVDLIVLDVGPQGDQWLDVACSVRAASNIPIVLISAKASPDDRVHGLENGADDYIVKPFDIREVILRIGKILRRYQRSDGGGATQTVNERYRLDFGVLDVARRELRTLAGELLALTSAELDLLIIFVREPRRIMSRDEIMWRFKKKVWSPLDRSLDKCIAQLRKKIEPQDDISYFIKSVRSVGYVYAGVVERL